MNKKIATLGITVLVLAAAGGAYVYWHAHRAANGQDSAGGAGAPGGSGGKRGPGGDGRPMPVQAQKVVRGDIDITVEALGTVTARNTATVKARVSGPLQEIRFQEGQKVRAGDVLAVIDPRPYQAVLDQAQGQLARDQALLANARKDLDRYQTLLKKDSIASQQVDNQEWLVKQYEGTVLNDQGTVESARLQLEFTRITSPITGRLGLRQVDVGNYVQTSDANGIVVVTQTQPIFIVFTVPADRLGQILPRLRKGGKLVVRAYDASGKNLLATGRLASIDNQIDVTTGTVKLKAEFANDDDALYPNQFVNVKLGVDTLHDALLVPTASIQRGSRGTFVYAVDESGAVHVQDVKLGTSSETQVAVEGDLKPGTAVVTDGADKLREGARVTITTPGAALGTRGGKARAGSGAGSGNWPRKSHDGQAGSTPGASPAPGGAASAPASAP